jgi:hypothetical protein
MDTVQILEGLCEDLERRILNAAYRYRRSSADEGAYWRGRKLGFQSSLGLVQKRLKAARREEGVPF